MELVRCALGCEAKETDLFVAVEGREGVPSIADNVTSEFGDRGGWSGHWGGITITIALKQVWDRTMQNGWTYAAVLPDREDEDVPSTPLRRRM